MNEPVPNLYPPRKTNMNANDKNTAAAEMNSIPQQRYMNYPQDSYDHYRGFYPSRDNHHHNNNNNMHFPHYPLMPEHYRYHPSHQFRRTPPPSPNRNQIMYGRYLSHSHSHSPPPHVSTSKTPQDDTGYNSPSKHRNKHRRLYSYDLKLNTITRPFHPSDGKEREQRNEKEKSPIESNIFSTKKKATLHHKRESSAGLDMLSYVADVSNQELAAAIDKPSTKHHQRDLSISSLSEFILQSNDKRHKRNFSLLSISSPVPQTEGATHHKRIDSNWSNFSGMSAITPPFNPDSTFQSGQPENNVRKSMLPPPPHLFHSQHHDTSPTDANAPYNHQAPRYESHHPYHHLQNYPPLYPRYHEPHAHGQGRPPPTLPLSSYSHPRMIRPNAQELNTHFSSGENGEVIFKKEESRNTRKIPIPDTSNVPSESDMVCIPVNDDAIAHSGSTSTHNSPVSKANSSTSANDNESSESPDIKTAVAAPKTPPLCKEISNKDTQKAVSAKENNSESPSNETKTNKKPVKRARRKCSQPGCTNRVVQGGLCISHGAKRKTCNHPGCTKNVKKAGLCSTHGPARKRCEVDGCEKVAVQGGKCIAHGARKRLCKVSGCSKQSILGGMCKKHHDEVSKSKVTKNTKTSTASPPRDGSNQQQSIVKQVHHPLVTPSPATVTRTLSSKASLPPPPQSQHKRGLSVFHDPSTVDKIIQGDGMVDLVATASGEPKMNGIVGLVGQQEETSLALPPAKKRYTRHQRGLSIFTETDVAENIIKKNIII